MLQHFVDIFAGVCYNHYGFIVLYKGIKMGRKSVAVLDVRSSEIAVMIGERGVNNTFIFKASKTEPYDGYDETGKFFDEKNLTECIRNAISSVEQTCGERIRSLYVGVPGGFTKVISKESNIGFPKKRKITQRELDALFQSGAETVEGYRLIRATSMIYTTSDNRRVVDPTGIAASSLSGLLSYFYCSDYYADFMEELCKSMKIALRFLPTEFAMAKYLIPSETRDEYALFLDVGFLSSSVLVLFGNGVLAQETHWTGRGQIVVELMNRLHLPTTAYEATLALLSRANLFAKEATGSVEFNFRGNTYEIQAETFIETVREGLDGLCEALAPFMDLCASRELDYKPLYISGEGLMDIRGALEHLSKRFNRVCEQLSPNLPYYNKPGMSSYVALMDMALEDRSKSGIINRIINAFGG